MHTHTHTLQKLKGCVLKTNMEALYYYLAYIIVLLLLLLLLLPLSLYLTAPENPKRLPPGSKGWPVLGESIAYVFSGPPKFVRDRMERYSPDVFRTSLLGEDVAVLCGARGHRFLFANEDKLVTPWLPGSIRKVLMCADEPGGGPLFRRFRHDTLKPQALRHYVPVMDRVAREHLDGAGSVVRISHLSRKYTFHLACRLFMGLAEPERVKRLAEPFALVTRGLMSVPVDFPGTAYHRAIRGGKVVREELRRIVEERRRELMTTTTEKGETGMSDDILSKMLLAAADDEGDEEISKDIMGLLLASFDNISSVVTSVIGYLAQLAHIYDGVFKEQMEIVESKGPGDELLTWDDVEKMKYSWNVVRECLRLMPPSQGFFRETTAEFTFAGYTIPKGWKTFWTVHSSHKDPKYFPEPEKFDPSRFEGSGPAPYAFIPFGGGPRMCPGREYARLAVLVFIHNVVRRFKLKKAIPNEKVVYHSSPLPVHGLPVHLEPHDYNK